MVKLSMGFTLNHKLHLIIIMMFNINVRDVGFMVRRYNG